MSSRKDRSAGPADEAGDETFLSRWARLKRESGEQAPVAPPTRPAPDAMTAHDEHSAEAADDTPAEAPPERPALELPPLESLTEESDFGPFMQAGVDPDLRRQALRKMFRNPKYAVVDELDPYRADFAAFTPLGDIITSDMKFHAERLLREQLEKAAESQEADALTAGQDDVQGPQPEDASSAAANEGPQTQPTEAEDERRDG